jgi:hypothetical protein
VTEHGGARRLDIRCGFSKQFLSGKLNERHTSQVWFKDGNRLEFTFNFGCGLFTAPFGDNPISFFQNLIDAGLAGTPLNEDEGQWRMFRSFFFAIHGSTQLQFQPSTLFREEMFLEGTVKDLDLTVRELKVFKGTGQDEHEMTSEEAVWNERIKELREAIIEGGLGYYMSQFPLIQGIPMSPFPKWQRCLGMTPRSGALEIKDRYVRVAFNLKLQRADESCLFSNFETLEKEKVWWTRIFNLADVSKEAAKLSDTYFNRNNQDWDARQEKRMQKRREKRMKARGNKEGAQFENSREGPQ